MSVCVAPPPIPVRAPPSPPMGATARPLRPRPHSASSIPNAFHHSLLSSGERSRATDMPHAFHDAVLRADTAPKSIRTFKGHAKGILRQLFLALLVRFFLAVAVALGIVGTAAWYVWAHRSDERLSFRLSLPLGRPTW